MAGAGRTQRSCAAAPRWLSGGRRRPCHARAMAGQPKLVLAELNEPNPRSVTAAKRMRLIPNTQRPKPVRLHFRHARSRSDVARRVGCACTTARSSLDHCSKRALQIKGTPHVDEARQRLTAIAPHSAWRSGKSPRSGRTNTLQRLQSHKNTEHHPQPAGTSAESTNQLQSAEPGESWSTDWRM